jgi:hypothetical protein
MRWKNAFNLGKGKGEKMKLQIINMAGNVVRTAHLDGEDDQGAYFSIIPPILNYNGAAYNKLDNELYFSTGQDPDWDLVEFKIRKGTYITVQIGALR